MKIAVWFSCGAPSAVAAKLAVDEYGRLGDEVVICNNPVREEGLDNRRFLRDVSNWIGQEIISVTHPDYPDASVEEVWDHEKAMVFPHGAPCTRLLKKGARQIWEHNNTIDWHVLGFTLEEQARHDRFVLTERSNVLPVLIERGLTRADCFRIVQEAGLELPEAYRLGYPNANCRGCCKATSPTYWNHVRVTDPDVFERRATQSRRLNVRLVRYLGKRIFLDELPTTAKGRPLKSMPDCSTFCEEKTVKVRGPRRG